MELIPKITSLISAGVMLYKIVKKKIAPKGCANTDFASSYHLVDTSDLLKPWYVSHRGMGHILQRDKDWNDGKEWSDDIRTVDSVVVMVSLLKRVLKSMLVENALYEIMARFLQCRCSNIMPLFSKLSRAFSMHTISSYYDKVEIIRDPSISDLNTRLHPHFYDLFHRCKRYEYPTVRLTITIDRHETEIFMMQRQLICLILHGVTFRQIHENNRRRRDKPSILYNPLMGCCGEPFIDDRKLVGVMREVDLPDRAMPNVSHYEYPDKSMMLYCQNHHRNSIYLYHEYYYSLVPLETQLLSILLHAKNNIKIRCE